MTVSPTLAAPPDLAGSRFLGSAAIALGVAAWGAVCGSLVESAVASGPLAQAGAVVGAIILAGCGAGLALAEALRFGAKETMGRALREALRSSWQGAWLGGLIGGAFAAGGGVRLALLLVVGPAAGAAVGLLLGRLWQVGGRVGRLNLALSLALVGGVLVATFCGAAGAPGLSPAAATAALQQSPIFGPDAGWAWGVGGAAPLVLAVGVWWLCAYRREPTRDGEKALGLGWGLATLVFLAALAGGLGAALGTAAQWLTGQLVVAGAATPTTGKWLGAVVALLLWGSARQPVQSITLGGLRQRIVGVASALLKQSDAAALAESR